MQNPVIDAVSPFDLETAPQSRTFTCTIVYPTTNPHVRIHVHIHVHSHMHVRIPLYIQMHRPIHRHTCVYITVVRSDTETRGAPGTPSASCSCSSPWACSLRRAGGTSSLVMRRATRCRGPGESATLVAYLVDARGGLFGPAWMEMGRSLAGSLPNMLGSAGGSARGISM